MDLRKSLKERIIEMNEIVLANANEKKIEDAKEVIKIRHASYNLIPAFKNVDDELYTATLALMNNSVNIQEFIEKKKENLMLCHIYLTEEHGWQLSNEFYMHNQITEEFLETLEEKFKLIG